MTFDEVLSKLEKSVAEFNRRLAGLEEASARQEEAIQRLERRMGPEWEPEHRPPWHAN